MPTWLNTVRIAPLTGPTILPPPAPPDPEPRPLQNTNRWDLTGVDEGVSVIFNGRTFIYFGDVENRCNFDLIAWTGEPHVHTHGGHRMIGLQFFLPNSGQPQSGPTSKQQRTWWYCVKCMSLFYSLSGTGAGRCTYDNGYHNRAGLEFYLPAVELGASPSSGQTDWRYCGKCNGLCYAPAKDGFGNPLPTGSCPAGGQHAPVGWTFVLPNDQYGTPATGQQSWRYCYFCRGLFFDGYIHKGACPSAPGGGLRLNAVLRSGTQEQGTYYPFQADGVVGTLQSVERPGGAFPWNKRVYVFANIASPQYSNKVRDGNPQFGQYLLSTDAPDSSRPLKTHYLFSPRIGNCRLADGTLRSHNPLGKYFFVRTDSGIPTPWRRCRHCGSLFELVSGNPGRCFGSSAGHSPYNENLNYQIKPGPFPNSQADWRRCDNCLMLVFDGYAWKQRCPGGGNHLPAGPSCAIEFQPGVQQNESQEGTYPNTCTSKGKDSGGALSDANTVLGGWRYCAECQALVQTRASYGAQENTIGAAVPFVVTVADHSDLPPPPATGGVTFSGKAAVMISHRFGSFAPGRRRPGFNLACWHLPVGADPRLEDLLYFNAETRQWTPDVSTLEQNSSGAQVPNLFDYTPSSTTHDGYTETGLLWLPAPARWLMTYTTGQAGNIDTGKHSSLGVVYARFAAKITDLGQALDVPIFDPITRPAERALITDLNFGYPYGPYPLEQYTTWDPRMGILDLYYLLSLYRPYQVQVMRTQIRLP